LRTTLTLDPDVSAEIERRRRARATSLKHEVNELLRAGLRAAAEPAEPSRRYELPLLDAGEPLVPIDDVAEALRIAEGDDYR
jgi:hypothetical protein